MSATERVPGVATMDGRSQKSKSKSRTGCITCKFKRLKCDEQKPFCNNCTKKNIKCGGYATRFKWRSCNDNIEPLQYQPSSHTPASHSQSQYALTPRSDGTKNTPSSTTSMSVLLEPLRRNVLVKTEPTDSQSLLLKQHLELASLSVVGKSTRDIKFENELLAKGINPDTYDGSPNESKRMRRSYSYNDSPAMTATPFHRSNSTSSHNILDIQSFRDEFRKSNGLESLAEAAVDEMKTRSPMAETIGFELDNISLSHFHQDKSPKPSNLAPTPKEFSVPTPKEWLLTGHLPNSSEIPTPQGKDTMSDLNLTPSLTALINYVFTNDDLQKGTMDPSVIKLGGIGEVPLSPLDLSIGNGSTLDLSNNHALLLRRESLGNHSASALVSKHSPYTTPNQLLFDVGDQLSQYEPLSPSIATSSSLQSLLRSSEYEQILFLFSTYTCGIMSIKAGMTENPWRNVILPLATNYSYLFNSIASMTLFHLAGNAKLGDKSAGLRSKGYFYMKKCILELASGLTKMDNNIVCENQLPADIALATCLNLAVSESWDTHTSSGIAHLKGAKSMIQKVLTLIKQHMGSFSGKNKIKEVSREDMKKKLVLVSNEDWNRIEEVAKENGNTNSVFVPRNLQLLFNAWIYFEVLSQMTSYSCHDDKGIDLVATITRIIHQTQKKRDEDSTKGSKHSDQSDSPNSESQELVASTSQPFGFLENFDTMISNNDYVDPLLGCAQSLFLIMGRVANLIAKVCRDRKDKKVTRTSLSNISTASELRKQLLDWKPTITAQMDISADGTRDSTWDTYSCVSTAEAYRFATLLYLHQAVPELPFLSSHQLAEKIFVLLASIPSDSNVHIIHIFPLLVSSCEAEPGEEREWCEQRWALLTERIWIGNIDRALEVVKEVWRRKDEHTRKVRRDMDDSTFAKQMNLDLASNAQSHGMNNDGIDDQNGIGSRLHWSSVMREWGWEVLLA
ncbi:CIC11C00000000772 [Sungouiella intermedia]|uniref:CIC11C00000000772 n=1 Tax=Sungouiella intermedia TaxID=45354 RepID=A0A1L0D0M2_9ASCO|nr:CIC11C00000000772 [[Candida] intermedia]